MKIEVENEEEAEVKEKGMNSLTTAWVDCPASASPES